MHMYLENIWEWHILPFPEVCHGMSARKLEFLPPSTRAHLFLYSKNIGFYSTWVRWNRYVPLLLFCLCCWRSPILTQIDIQCRPIGFRYQIFLTDFQPHDLHATALCKRSFKICFTVFITSSLFTAWYSCLLSLIFSVVFHSIPFNKSVQRSFLYSSIIELMSSLVLHVTTPYMGSNCCCGGNFHIVIHCTSSHCSIGILSK